METDRTLEKTYSKLGNEICLVEKSPGNKTILIIGVIHGDEPSGKYIIDKYVAPQNTKNKLLFIPCLNPDGLAACTRVNVNGVDLNRNFPSKNWVSSKRDIYFGGDSPASEQETKFLISVLNKYSPDIILTLHEPYRIVNYDGPAKEIAREISLITNYKLEESIGYPTPGSLGTYCGIERNIPTITLEHAPTVFSEGAEPPIVTKESLYSISEKVIDFLANID